MYMWDVTGSQYSSRNVSKWAGEWGLLACTWQCGWVWVSLQGQNEEVLKNWPSDY